MADSWLSTNGWGVFDGVAAAVFWAVGGVCLHKADQIISNRFKIRALFKVYGAIAVFFVGLFFFPGQDNWLLKVAAFVAAAISLGFVLRAIMKGYDDLGIGSAFYST
jgi:hypothetical protein